MVDRAHWIWASLTVSALWWTEAPVAIAERGWWQEAFSEPDPARSIRLYDRNITRVTAGIVPLWGAIQTAAAIDNEEAGLWAQLLRQRRKAMAGVAEALASKAVLRRDVEAVTDIRWALVPDSYLRLVHDQVGRSIVTKVGWPMYWSGHF